MRTARSAPNRQRFLLGKARVRLTGRAASHNRFIPMWDRDWLASREHRCNQPHMLVFYLPSVSVTPPPHPFPSLPLPSPLPFYPLPPLVRNRSPSAPAVSTFLWLERPRWSCEGTDWKTTQWPLARHAACCGLGFGLRGPSVWWGKRSPLGSQKWCLK